MGNHPPFFFVASSGLLIGADLRGAGRRVRLRGMSRPFALSDFHP